MFYKCVILPLKGRFSSGWDGASAIQLFREIDGNRLSDLIKCTILQEEVKLVWEKSAQKLRKYQETYIRIKLGYPRVLVELIVTARSNLQRTLSHRDWPANAYTHSIPRCVRYSDKLPMKITCNCWNNSLWNHHSAKPGKQMSLEFPRIVSLQIQVTTKDFKSWIHYWTIPLICRY